MAKVFEFRIEIGSIQYFLDLEWWYYKDDKRGLQKKRPFFVVFVVVDAIGLEMDFTLETNRKRIKNIVLLVFDTGLVFPRIWALQATFEAVLSAVDMT